MVLDRIPRLGATIAVLCAAASTGVIIPVLRSLVEQTGHGSFAAGVFTAAHVLGGVVGAALGGRALRRAGSARRLAAAALIASVAVTLAMAPVASLELRIALRFLDGGCHLLAITALVATATGGDPDQRARRAVIMGLAIVLGVPAERPAPAAPRRARDRGPIAPGMLAFCERFSFGSMTVAVPFLATSP